MSNVILDLHPFLHTTAVIPVCLSILGDTITHGIHHEIKGILAVEL